MEMEKTSLLEEQDDLEIISIGALYRGHWQNKYWSSSRAKDRYPYPVGYHALRIHAGFRCKMEIGEGQRGPSFMVGPIDGDACIGLTPDLAWESFHKKNRPEFKNWQGRRRFSSKMDGTELFGFKNKVVQRLLRQLVAASSRSPQSQISSSGLKPNETLQEHHSIGKTCPPHETVSSRKRSVNHKEKQRKSKKHHEFSVDGEEGPSGTGTTIKESLDTPADSQKEKRGHKELALAEGNYELKLKHAVSEENCSVLPFEAENQLKGCSENESDDFLKVVPDSPLSTNVVEKDPMNEVVEDSEMSISINEVVEDSEMSTAINEVVEDSEIPSSINVVRDSQPSSSENEVVRDSQPSSSENEVVGDSRPSSAINKVVRDSQPSSSENEVVGDFQPSSAINKVVRDSQTSSAINEIVEDSEMSSSSDFSSQWTDQDLTRSMMECLLPQAVPLLPKRNRRRTRKTIKNKHRENISFPCDQNAQPVEVGFTAAQLKTEAMNQEPNEKTNIEEVTCVIADSFEDNLDQKIESPTLCVMADSFEGYSNQKIIESRIASPVTKEGANMQNDQGELSDSFLAGLEEEIRAIENEAMLKKTNMHHETLMDPSGDSEIPKGNLFEHPEPVLSLAISSKDSNCLEICVLCGEFNACIRYLYIYNLVEGQPSFVGHTAMFVKSTTEAPSNENLALKRGGLQYISEGRLLLIPSIKMPYCRKRCISCSCSICKLEKAEENCLKLVRVDLGFVVPVTKFKTNEKVSSLLVCKPNFMIAVETTRLHVWVMSSTWRAVSDDFTLPTLGNMAPSKLELKQVPESNALVLGHDGFGAFFLWDISQRAFLAKFQAPNSSISKMIPMSCFDLTKTEFSNGPNIKLGENCLAVWLLVECQTDLKAMNQGWRPALLAKDKLFMGHDWDPRISALDAYANVGFVGTLDGFYYKYDFNYGRRVKCVDCFYSGSVSCIAVDPKSGAVVVAGNETQVLVYNEQN